MRIIKGICKFFAPFVLFYSSAFAAFTLVYFCFRIFTENVFDTLLFEILGPFAIAILAYQFIKLFFYLDEKIKDSIKDFRENAKISKYLTASLLIVVIAALAVLPSVTFFNYVLNPKPAGEDANQVIVKSDSIDDKNSIRDNYYVLNTSSKKFHYSSCGSVKQMKAKNTDYFTGTREAIIALGYSPCGKCKP